MSRRESDFPNEPRTVGDLMNRIDEALLERARNHVMTPAERIAQRRSWVKGEFMMEHPEMDEATVDALLDKTLPELARKDNPR